MRYAAMQPAGVRSVTHAWSVLMHTHPRHPWETLQLAPLACSPVSATYSRHYNVLAAHCSRIALHARQQCMLQLRVCTPVQYGLSAHDSVRSCTCDKWIDTLTVAL